MTIGGRLRRPSADAAAARGGARSTDRFEPLELPWRRRPAAWARRQGREILLARLALILGSVLTSISTRLASGDLAMGAILFLTLLAVMAAALPDTVAAAIVVLAQFGAWWWTVPAPPSLATLGLASGAAAGLILVHLAAATLGVWPPGSEIPNAFWIRWARRAALVTAATAATAVLAAAVAAPTGRGDRWLSLIALVALTAGALWAYQSSTAPDQSD